MAYGCACRVLSTSALQLFTDYYLLLQNQLVIMNVVFLLDNEIVYNMISFLVLNVFFKQFFLAHLNTSAVHLLVVLNTTRVTETGMQSVYFSAHVRETTLCFFFLLF